MGRTRRGAITTLVVTTISSDSWSKQLVFPADMYRSIGNLLGRHAPERGTPHGAIGAAWLAGDRRARAAAVLCGLLPGRRTRRMHRRHCLALAAPDWPREDLAHRTPRGVRAPARRARR